MSSQDFPQVRISLDSMHEHFMTHLVLRHDEIQNAVSAEVRDFIEKYDFKEQIHEELKVILRDAIRASLKGSVEAALHSPEVLKIFNGIAHAAVLDALEKEQTG
jgi:hypothetical protein